MQILERKQLQDLEKQNDLYITHQQVGPSRARIFNVMEPRNRFQGKNYASL
jgi:hypothetical protein